MDGWEVIVGVGVLVGACRGVTRGQAREWSSMLKPHCPGALS